jgi:hypothetical protein
MGAAGREAAGGSGFGFEHKRFEPRPWGPMSWCWLKLGLQLRYAKPADGDPVAVQAQVGRCCRSRYSAVGLSILIGSTVSYCVNACHLLTSQVCGLDSSRLQPPQLKAGLQRGYEDSGPEVVPVPVSARDASLPHRAWRGQAKWGSDVAISAGHSPVPRSPQTAFCTAGARAAAEPAPAIAPSLLPPPILSSLHGTLMHEWSSIEQCRTAGFKLSASPPNPPSPVHDYLP